MEDHDSFRIHSFLYGMVIGGSIGMIAYTMFLAIAGM